MGRGPGGRGGARGGRQGRGGFQGGRGRGRGGRGGLGPQGGVGKKHGGDRNGNKHRSVKNQIRGVERLLKREGLDPRARAAKEAELAELKAAQAAHAQAERERKYAVMYHKVKFFERVKLERAIKRHERALAGAGAGDIDSGDDAEEDRGASGTADAGAGGHADKAVPAEPAEIRERLAKLKEDLQYVLHFPKGKKYVSILKNAEDPEAQKHLEAERERLRGIIRKQLAEVAAVTEADEGRALLGDKALAAAVPSKGPPARRKGDDKPGAPAVRAVQSGKPVARRGDVGKPASEGMDSLEASEAASDDFFLAGGGEERGSDRPESEDEEEEDGEEEEDDAMDGDGGKEEGVAAPKPRPPAANPRLSTKAPVGAAAAGPAATVNAKKQAAGPGAGSKRGQAFLAADAGAEGDDFFLAAGSDDEDQPAAGLSYKLQTATGNPPAWASAEAPDDRTKGRDSAKGEARPGRGADEGRRPARGGEGGRGREDQQELPAASQAARPGPRLFPAAEGQAGVGGGGGEATHITNTGTIADSPSVGPTQEPANSRLGPGVFGVPRPAYSADCVAETVLSAPSLHAGGRSPQSAAAAAPSTGAAAAAAAIAVVVTLNTAAVALCAVQQAALVAKDKEIEALASSNARLTGERDGLKLQADQEYAVLQGVTERNDEERAEKAAPLAATQARLAAKEAELAAARAQLADIGRRSEPQLQKAPADGPVLRVSGLQRPRQG